MIGKTCQFLIVLFFLTLIQPVFAKEYIREIYLNEDPNSPLSVNFLATRQLKRTLAAELWSYKEESWQATTDELKQDDFVITNKEISSAIQLVKVLEEKSFEGTYYKRVILSANEDSIKKITSKNLSKLKIQRRSVQYTGGKSDSKAKILKNALEQMKLELLFSTQLLAEADLTLLSQGNKQFIEETAKVTLSGNISIKDIIDVTWAKNTVSVTADISIFEGGLFEDSAVVKDKVFSKMETFDYLNRPIKPYYFTAASARFKKATAMYEKSKNPKRKAALKLYEKEAKAGDVDAQWLLCHAQTWQQSPAKVKLPHYQFDWCKEAAFNGHALSQVTLGYYYSIGVGLDDDQHAALFWLQQGLVSVPIQQQHLILTNYQIFGYAPKPLKTYPSNVPAYTAKYLEKGYQAIGDIYTYGRGVKANPVKGREYYTKCIQYKGITYEGGCDFMLGNIADQEKDNYEKESKEYQERQAKAAYHYSMASRKRHLTAAVKAAEYLRAGAIEPVFFFKSLYNFDYIESDRAISKETRNHVAAVFFINKLLEGYDRVGFIADAYARIRYQQDYMHILNQKDIEELTKFESRGSVYSAFLLGGNALNKNRYQDAVNYLENAVFGGYKEAKEHLLGAYIAMWLNNESYSREWDVSHGEWDSKSSLLRKMMLLSKEMSNLGSKFADVYRPQLIEELELEPFYKKLREKKGLPNFSSK